jgi:hypothetical protein
MDSQRIAHTVKLFCLGLNMHGTLQDCKTALSDHVSISWAPACYGALNSLPGVCILILSSLVGNLHCYATLLSVVLNAAAQGWVSETRREVLAAVS